MADELWLDGAATPIVANEGDWSPDGTRLLLHQLDGTLGVLDVATGAVKQLGIKAAGFAWSPDGLSLAYIAKGKLWIAAANGTHAQAIVSSPQGGGLAWQPLPR